MFCRGAQATIFSSTGIVTASGILCMPIPFISLLLPGASASGWRVPTRDQVKPIRADQDKGRRNDSRNTCIRACFRLLLTSGTGSALLDLYL
jgi:hypothetical protein